jgi:WD40 repeat protein/DNA-binding SARP family transcriptional activator
MPGTSVEFRILGPLDVLVDGESVRIGGPRLRALLALLLLSANRVVSRDRLLDELARDEAAADRQLRVQVSRLRKALALDGEPRLVAQPPGYLLRVEPGELDLERFEQLVAEARSAVGEDDLARGVELLEKALALWRGRPLADLEFEPFARLEVERLEELRLTAVEERIEAELALGRHTQVVPELEALVEEHPLREGLRGHLMLALYRSGRQAEALETYRRTHTLLDQELGLRPGVALQQLERAILVQDAALGPPPQSGGNGTRTRSVPVCPFKGLAPFEPSDAPFYFGRERLVTELVGRLAAQPLVAILGPSGSGKSSLLRAGLIPALAGGALPGSDGWRLTVLRPGHRPAAQLERALAPVADGERQLVAVDQFEEVFTACTDERERRAFIRGLVDAAWDPDRSTLVGIALRADFYGSLASHPELSDLVGSSHVLLGPMSERELRRTIEGPAERAGLTVERDLVDALVSDVAGEAGGLPLLSTALLELWQDRADGGLELTAYDRMGRVHGAVTRLAEAAYGRLDERRQGLARRLLLRLADGEGDSATRRRLAIDDLDAVTARVATELADERLLTVSDGTVEVAHEALLTHWPRLRDWLEEDAQGRRLHRHLMEASADWLEAQRAPAELYRGARLSAALDWADAHSPELTEAERDFLEASRLASARDAERQRRANRRLRALLAAAFVLLLLAIAAGIFALDKRSQARGEATAAEAQRLGAQALIEPRLDRSLLLAREGVALDDSLATRGYLLADLLRSPAAIGVAREGSDRILDEALSPDGRTVAVRGDDGAVVFFDALTLRRVGRPFPGSNQIGFCGAVVGPLRALGFSPDGRTLVIGEGDGSTASLELVDARTHAERAGVQSGTGIVADVAFSPDGTAIATGEPVSCAQHPPAEVIVTRDPRTGQARRRSAPIPGGRLAGYTPDKRSLLVTRGSGSSVLLDASTLRVVETLPFGAPAALAPSGDQAAFAGTDGGVSLVDLATGRERTLPGRVDGQVDGLRFSGDGRAIVTVAEDGSVAVWEIPFGLRERFQGHTAAARSAVFSPDGRTLYTAAFDGSAIAWDVGGARRLGRPFRFASGPTSSAVAVAPSGAFFVVSPGRDRVALRRTETLAALPGELRSRLGDVAGLAVSRDGRLVGAAGSRGAAVWDVRSRTVARTFPVGPHGADAIAFSPDGHTAAVGLADGGTAVYDLRTGRETAEVPSDGSPTDVDFSPDGRLLASAGLAGTATLWDVARGRVAADLTGQPADFSLHFSPDGKLVAVGDSSGAVVFWNVAGRRKVGAPLVGHNGGVVSLAFDRSGRTLVTSGSDGKLRLWDIASRRLIGAPLPGSSSGGSTAFFPDGRHVVGVFDDGTGVIWNVAPSAWEAHACAVARRTLTRAEWADFLGGRTYEPVCR